MTKFVGKLCPVCRERFKENDDVAVCPYCGTPHHRACYLERNKCALEDLHGEFTWKGSLPDEPSQPPEEISSEERESREEIEKFLRDLEKITGVEAKLMIGDELDPTEQEVEAQVRREVEEMLGLLPEYKNDPILAGYYMALVHSLLKTEPGVDGVSQRELTFFSAFSLKHFQKAFKPFLRGLRKTGFNLLGGILMPINQFFRRMDGLAFALLALIMLAEGLPVALERFALAPAELTGALLIGGRILLGAAALLMCFFGDYIYYKFAVKRIKKVREQFKGSENTMDYFTALYVSGRPSLLKGLFGILAVAFVRVMIGVAAM